MNRFERGCLNLEASHRICCDANNSLHLILGTCHLIGLFLFRSNQTIVNDSFHNSEFRPYHTDKNYTKLILLIYEARGTSPKCRFPYRARYGKGTDTSEKCPLNDS